MNELTLFDQIAPIVFGLPVAAASLWFGFTTPELRRRVWFALTGFTEDNFTDSFSKKNTDRAVAHSYNMKVADLDGLSYLDVVAVKKDLSEPDEPSKEVVESGEIDFEPEISDGYFDKKYGGTKVDPQEMKERLLG